MMRRWGMVAAVVVALGVLGAGPAAADACKRSCAVFMRTKCRHGVLSGGAKDWQKMCRSLFDPHTHKCKVGADCLGFANLAKCRTAGTQFAFKEWRSKCGTDARKSCQACCSAGGTVDSCVHSPSGAFLDF